jgi:hypothetical protein
MDLSERLLSFLGKRENDSDFQAFLLEMKDRFEIRMTPFDSDHLWQGYYFDKQGFWLHIEPNYDFIFEVAFSITGTKSGLIQPFQGVLPLGILNTDNQEAIRRRLEVKPRSKCKTYVGKNGEHRELHTDSYKIAPFEYLVKFYKPEDGLVLLEVCIATGMVELHGKSVVFATCDVEKGTEITVDSVVRRKVPPRRTVPEDTINNTGQAIGRKAKHKISSGQIVTGADLE